MDPEIGHDKPVIKGTRVPIEVVLGSLAGGMDIENVCEKYELEKEAFTLPLIMLAAEFRRGINSDGSLKSCLH